MNNKSFYIVFASSLMLLICIFYQGSYAYFSASVGGRGNTTGNQSEVTTDELQDLVITDGDNIGSSSMLPGDEITTTFTVKNPNKIDICFDLNLTDVTNTFINQNDLRYEIELDGAVFGGVFPSTGETENMRNISISANSTQTYTLTITYENTPDNQIEDMGKSFSGRVVGELASCVIYGS